jgi:integrase
MSTGIVVRHRRSCATQDDGECNCKPAYRAEVYDRRSGKKVRRTFHNLNEARGWRHDAASELRKGMLSTPTKTTLRAAADAWLEAARAGTIRTRRGAPYKPSVLRSYDQALRDHVLPELGYLKLHDVRRRDLQDLADKMLAKGLDPSTIRNAIAPVRVIFRRAVSRGEIAVNPTSGLELPTPQGHRERIASPSEAETLIGALVERDQALWATAFYAGLRSGEIQGLDWSAVDFSAGVIRVERAYDPKARTFVEPKSKKGRRSIPAVLRGSSWSIRCAREEGMGSCSGATPSTPSRPRTSGVGLTQPGSG